MSALIDFVDDEDVKRVLIFWDPKSNALTAGQNAPATYVHLIIPRDRFFPRRKGGCPLICAVAAVAPRCRLP